MPGEDKNPSTRAAGALRALRKAERRAMQEERFSVSFPITLMWEEAGTVHRIPGRCVDLSPEGIKVESRDRVRSGTTVLVSSHQFGRMGQATVRHVQREKMQCLIGLKFVTAFGLGDPARRKILEQVLSPDDPHAAAGGLVDDPGKTIESAD